MVVNVDDVTAKNEEGSYEDCEGCEGYWMGKQGPGSRSCSGMLSPPNLYDHRLLQRPEDDKRRFDKITDQGPWYTRLSMRARLMTVWIGFLPPRSSRYVRHRDTDVHGLGGWLLPFLRLANDLRDSDLLQEFYAHLAMTHQLASKVDDMKDIKQVLAKTRRSVTLHSSDMVF